MYPKYSAVLPLTIHQLNVVHQFVKYLMCCLYDDVVTIQQTVYSMDDQIGYEVSI